MKLPEFLLHKKIISSMTAKINKGSEYRCLSDGAGVRRITGVVVRKDLTRNGTWSIRILLKTGMTHNVMQKMKWNNIKMSGLTEVRWHGKANLNILGNEEKKQKITHRFNSKVRKSNNLKLTEVEEQWGNFKDSVIVI